VTFAKADFNSIYNRPDPVAYYGTLGELDYEIPQHGAEVFEKVIASYPCEAPPLTVLDVCCSYGVGGALLKSDLTLSDLYRHYRQNSEFSDDVDALVRSDKRLLDAHRRPNPPRIVGLDIAEHAIDYAVRSNCLDAGFADDLENGTASPDLLKELGAVDLITTTGGIGYVSAKTFTQLIDAAPDTAWVAAFCLRAYDYRPIADLLTQRGYITERATAGFRQRRFADAEEQRWAVEQIQGSGLSADGMESTGWYYADFYLSRPSGTPGAAVDELLGSSGRP
jgi:hypothetical protein